MAPLRSESTCCIVQFSLTGRAKDISDEVQIKASGDDYTSVFLQRVNSTMRSRILQLKLMFA